MCWGQRSLFGWVSKEISDFRDRVECRECVGTVLYLGGGLVGLYCFSDQLSPLFFRLSVYKCHQVVIEVTYEQYKHTDTHH